MSVDVREIVTPVVGDLASFVVRCNAVTNETELSEVVSEFAPAIVGARTASLGPSSRTARFDGHTNEWLVAVVNAVVEGVFARISALADADELVRSKREYAAHISHEIRTPLNGVIGMLSLLQQTNLNGEQQEYVLAARASGETLLTVVNEALEYSRIEYQQIEHETLSFDIARAVNDAQRMVVTQARQQGIELRTVISPTLGTHAEGDPFRIQKILVNLLSNALKFTRSGHVEVAVDAATEPDAKGLFLVRFRVTDTGIGIAPELIDKLFQISFQTAGGQVGHRGKMGHGLAISKRMCEWMGGSISVTSQQNKGTVFSFTAKVRRPVLADRNSLKIAPIVPMAPRPGIRVLVAEDNPVNQRVAEMILRKNGFLVDVVSNGLEAVEALKKMKYEVILMDVQMPELDGLEATRRIVELYGTSRPRIVAMTASAMSGDREQCLDAGMDDYVDKPARASEILAAILRVLPSDA
jgi:signal transduction histidine kinase/ActR/RegA family two-component response regulator